VVTISALIPEAHIETTGPFRQPGAIWAWSGGNWSVWRSVLGCGLRLCRRSNDRRSGDGKLL